MGGWQLSHYSCRHADPHALQISLTSPWKEAPATGQMTARAPHSMLVRQRGHSSPGTSVPRRHFSTCLQGKLSSGV